MIIIIENACVDKTVSKISPVNSSFRSFPCEPVIFPAKLFSLCEGSDEFTRGFPVIPFLTVTVTASRPLLH